VTLKLVEVGLGILILQELAIREELAFGHLGAARLRGVNLGRALGLVHREYFSRALAAFVDQLTELGVYPPAAPARRRRSNRPRR
jgi:DNA-binding transcriptional LysR family regulator